MPEIIAYGSGEMLTQIFTAISMLMNDQSAHFYKPLLRMGAVVGGLWALSKAFWESSISGLIFHWMIPMAAFVGICLIPSTSVTIIDVLAGGPLGVARKVDHVPLGLARAAQSISFIGHLVTKAVETAFHAPDHSLYNKTGMIFGAENLLEMSRYAITDEHLADTMREFIHNCVTYDLTLELYSINDLKTAPNIWELIKNNTSNVRMFSLCTKQSASSEQDKRKRCKLVSCKEGTAELTTLLNAYKDKLKADHLLQHLPAFYQQLTGMAQDANVLIAQQMMMHSLIDAVERKCEANGIGTNFAIRRAYLQQRNTYEVVGGLAAKSLVILRNILEALIYAAFIFIMPFALMPMGFKVFMKWLWLLMWIQLWPPFYAILNSGIMTVTKHQALQIPGIENGLTLLTSTGLHNLALDMQTYAAYASLSIPFLSYALLQGGISSIAQVAGSITGVGQSAGSAAAHDLTTGNYNYGNVQLENLSYGNQTMLQHNLAPSLATGHYTENTGNSRTIHTPNSMIVDAPVSQFGIDLNGAEMLSQGMSHKANEETSFAEQSRESSVLSQMSNTRAHVDYLKHTAISKSYDNSIVAGTNKSISELSQETLKAAESFGQKYGLDTKTAAEFIINAGTGLSSKMGPTEKAKFEASLGATFSGRSSASKDKMYENAKNIYNESSFSKSFQSVSHAANNEQFNAHDEKGARLSHDIAQSAEESHQHQKQFEKHIQRSQHLSQLAEVATQQSTHINRRYNQEFVDYLANQKMVNGQIRGRMVAQHILVHSPHERDAAIGQFMDMKQKSLLSRHDLTTKEGFENSSTELLQKPITIQSPVQTTVKETVPQAIQEKLGATGAQPLNLWNYKPKDWADIDQKQNQLENTYKTMNDQITTHNNDTKGQNQTKHTTLESKFQDENKRSTIGRAFFNSYGVSTVVDTVSSVAKSFSRKENPPQDHVSQDFEQNMKSNNKEKK